MFPDALWLDYIDPGYTLCMVVRREIQLYKDQNGVEPNLIFLKNHGVFVSADSPEGIRDLYAEVLKKLMARYTAKEVEPVLGISCKNADVVVESDCNIIREAMGNTDLFIKSSGAFDLSPGPISPDHMVYAKAFPYMGRPTAEGIAEFIGKRGYAPQVFAFNGGVFGVADSENGAALALELAKDGALVEKLAAVFGGVDYMTDQAREFIENWEVESYRKKQI